MTPEHITLKQFQWLLTLGTLVTKYEIGKPKVMTVQHSKLAYSQSPTEFMVFVHAIGISDLSLLLTKLSDDGRDVIEDYRGGHIVFSQEAWNLLHRDDQAIVQQWLKDMQKMSWKWVLVPDGDSK